MKKRDIGRFVNNVSLEMLNKLPLILPDSVKQERIASKAFAIRAEACKLKSDAEIALDIAKMDYPDNLDKEKDG